MTKTAHHLRVVPTDDEQREVKLDRAAGLELLHGTPRRSEWLGRIESRARDAAVSYWLDHPHGDDDWEQFLLDQLDELVPSGEELLAFTLAAYTEIGHENIYADGAHYDSDTDIWPLAVLFWAWHRHFEELMVSWCRLLRQSAPDRGRELTGRSSLRQAGERCAGPARPPAAGPSSDPRLAR